MWEPFFCIITLWHPCLSTLWFLPSIPCGTCNSGSFAVLRTPLQSRLRFDLLESMSSFSLVWSSFCWSKLLNLFQERDVGAANLYVSENIWTVLVGCKYRWKVIFPCECRGLSSTVQKPLSTGKTGVQSNSQFFHRPAIFSSLEKGF